MIVSEARSAAARANGAKSSGPVTEAGKFRSSQNSPCHGLTARTLVRNNESPEACDQLVQACLDHFQPANALETQLVTELAAARWRLQRLWGLETATFDLQMDRQFPQIQRDFVCCDETTRTAVAFESLANDTRSLDLLNRYESRYSRQYHRALRVLHLLRSPVPENQKLPIEPKPAKQNKEDS